MMTGIGRLSRRAIIEWDVATWSRALPLWEAAVGPSLRGRRGLEIGGRGGGLSLWMAAKGCDVICSYHNEDMVTAKALHQMHRVAEHIRYEPIDATAIPYRDHFDLIMLKSVLGGIGAYDRPDRQREAVHQIHGALRPGGLFLFAENIVATPLHRLPRAIKWRGGWRYLTIDEMRTWLADFADVSFSTSGFLALFGPSERQRTMLARLDAAFCHYLPATWHYVMLGVARK